MSSDTRSKKNKNSAYKTDSKKKSPFKKFFNFFCDLFGTKTRKSLYAVISHLVESYEKEGLISSEEKKMFKNIASFGDKVASGCMTPRADIVAIDQNASLEEIKRTITRDGHTRIPVFRDNFDDIVGFIHSKDLAKFLCEEDDDFSINSIIRKILFVPGSMKLLDVMLHMRMARVHLAVVLDEFGGVDGIVTIENIMEEIVGNIEDEHDLPSESQFCRIKEISERIFHFGGRVEIEKMQKVLQTKIKSKDDDFETASGLVLSMFKGIPEIGEEIEKNGLKFKIIDADKRSVKLVEVEKISSQE